MSFGPVDFIVVRFPGTALSGDIASSLTELVEDQTIRIIDLLFLTKNALGEVNVEELTELDDLAYQGWDPVVSAVSGFMTDEDALMIAELLDPDSSAVLVLIENTWALKMVKSIANAQGDVLISERIPRPIVEDLIALHEELPA